MNISCSNIHRHALHQIITPACTQTLALKLAFPCSPNNNPVKTCCSLTIPYISIQRTHSIASSSSIHACIIHNSHESHQSHNTNPFNSHAQWHNKASIHDHSMCTIKQSTYNISSRTNFDLKSINKKLNYHFIAFPSNQLEFPPNKLAAIEQTIFISNQLTSSNKNWLTLTQLNISNNRN